MQWIYPFGIQLLKFALKLHGRFNKKSQKAIEGRKHLFEELGSRFSNNKRPVAWFHAASLGEFEQGRPLIEYFKQHHPNYFILLTFFSPSGYEVRKNYELADHVSYMPFDTEKNAQEFVNITQPKMAFFIKYEFWHFHLKALEDSNCWIFSVSSIFRSKQAYFKWYGGFYRNMLKKVDHFFVQNGHSKALLNGIGLNNVSISGDTRFDRVHHITQEVKEITSIKAFCAEHPTLIGGSTWEPDVKVIAHFLQQNQEWKAIIAPHDISEANLKKHENLLNVKSIRYSQLDKERNLDPYQVVIIDNIGMLTSLYQYGDAAFIGGAFGAGLHNTLEAACFGLAIFFGDKNFDKFQEANELLEIQAASTVSSAEEFSGLMHKLITEEAIPTMGEKSKHYIAENIGATEKIMAHIDPIIEKITHESQSI